MAALLLPGCGPILGEPPVFDFPCIVRVRVDAYTPIEAAVITMSGQASTTNESGEATLRPRGHEGERREVTVRCPDGFQSPTAPLVVFLHRMQEAQSRPRYEAKCTPLRRSVVLAVRIGHGPGLPITYLGRTIARTDADGVGHAVLKLSAGEPFQIRVDTSSAPLLIPQNPIMDFPGGEGDELVLLEQDLRRIPEVVRPSKRPRLRPTRI